MHKGHFFRAIFLGGLSCLFIMVMMTGCAGAGSPVASGPPTANSTVSSGMSTSMASKVNQESTLQFTLAGGRSGSYTLRAATPISKLRHGHREFTIDITQGQLSIFIVFFGYAGPKSYTLSKITNGGDVHFSLGDTAPSWDLSSQPTATCALMIDSDTPTALAGLDRMKGRFSCPLLFSSNPSDPQRSVTLRNGSFDIAIIVES